MKKINIIKILAVETSCDETSAAVLEFNKNAKSLEINLISNIVSSQIKLHAKYKGVYPELASREHVKNILPVISAAINNKTKIKDISLDKIKDIDYLAVTQGPGLIGSLLSGTQTVKNLSYLFKKPVILVNHLEGHMYASILEIQQNQIIFPIIALIVSGGHTTLVIIKNHFKYEIIGQTNDDAAGEAYDKVSTMLDLGYPGGPIIDEYAKKYINLAKNDSFEFPRPMLNSGKYDFSFSGLKTSVLYFLKKYKKPYSEKLKAKVAYKFQEAVIDVLVYKTIKAVKKFNAKTIIISGGVAANSRLRERIFEKAAHDKILAKILIPSGKYCTDNAAMIAAAAVYKILAGKVSTWYDIKANANLKLK